MTPDEFNERAQCVRVLWSKPKAAWCVIGIDGRILFTTQKSRTAVHVAEGFEGDYTDGSAA